MWKICKPWKDNTFFSNVVYAGKKSIYSLINVMQKACGKHIVYKSAHKYLLHICHFNLKRCDACFCDANTSRRSNVPRANDTLRNTFLIPVDASSHARYHWRICNRISHRRISVVKPRAFCEMPCDPYRYKWAPFARAPTVWRDEYTLESTVRARLLVTRFIFAVKRSCIDDGILAIYESARKSRKVPLQVCERFDRVCT